MEIKDRLKEFLFIRSQGEQLNVEKIERYLYKRKWEDIAEQITRLYNDLWAKRKATPKVG